MKLRSTPGSNYQDRVAGYRLVVSLSICTLMSVWATSQANADGPPKVEEALTARHTGVALNDLINAAGGEDQLVKELLELRTKESPGYISIRAERLLLNFADRPEVAEALEADMSSSKTPGFAKLIAANVDRVTSSELRAKLATRALNRAEEEPDFAPYAKQLLQSSDPAVQSIAKSRISAD